MTQLPRIPMELTSRIFCFCDQYTLAMVCRGNQKFLLESRHRLFHDLHLHERQARLILRAVDRFHLVQHLTLFDLYPDTSGRGPWADFVPHVVRLCPLQSLRLIPASPDSHGSESFHSIIHPLLFITSLQHIAISTTLASETQIIQCPAVKELSIVKLWSPSSTVVTTRRPSLSTLSLHYPLPRSFAFCGKQPADPVHLEWLQCISKTVEVLSFWNGFHLDEGIIWELYTSFPALRLLVLSESGHQDACFSEQNNLTVREMLGRAPNLRVVRLYRHWERCNPANMILSQPVNHVPGFSLRLGMIQFYFSEKGCYSTDDERRRANQALSIRFGQQRDVKIIWGLTEKQITPFK
ncbi:hypothetical protein DL96DRAFT_1610226 [Flagelloscypha sp. PMI_526]|nr:hypothetical protein DL96DRAFT_1610226 [Flagelloscypha sp. PMI_526]